MIARACASSGASAVEAILEEEQPAPEPTASAQRAAATPVRRRQIVRIHRQMPRWRRLAATFIVVVHLLALLAIPALLALQDWGWQLWLLVPFNVSMHLCLAASHSRAGGQLSLKSRPLLAFAVLLPASNGVALNSALSSPLPLWLSILLSVVGFATGLSCLVRITQVWLGQDFDARQLLIQQLEAGDNADFREASGGGTGSGHLFGVCRPPSIRPVPTTQSLNPSCWTT